MQHLQLPSTKRSGLSIKSSVSAAARLEAPPELSSLQLEQFRSCKKKLSNLSIRPNMHPISSFPLQVVPSLARSATDLWQQAFQHERESRASQSSQVASETKPADTYPAQNHSSVTSVHLKVGEWRGSKRSTSLETEAAPTHTTWSNRRELGTPYISRPISPYPGSWMPKKPSSYENHRHHAGKRTPPASWAKWPSHTRAERNQVAGVEDRVAARDFAIAIPAMEDAINVATHKNLPAHTSRPFTGRRSLSGRFAKAMKAGFNKMIAPKGRVGSEGNSLRNVVPSSRHRGELEYPELEILPTEAGYKELKALERTVESMKTGRPVKIVNTTEPPFHASHDIAPAAAAEISVAVEEKDSEEYPRGPAPSPDSRFENMAKTTVAVEDALHFRPETPANPFIQGVRESTMSANERFSTPPTSQPRQSRFQDSTLTTTTTERFATPRSRLSPAPSFGSLSAASATRSDSTIVHRAKSTRNTCDSTPKFSTWNGRSRTQPEALRTMPDFHQELRDKIEGRGEAASAMTPGMIREECKQHMLHASPF